MTKHFPRCPSPFSLEQLGHYKVHVSARRNLSVVEWEGINVNLIMLIVFNAPIKSKSKHST